MPSSAQPPQAARKPLRWLRVRGGLACTEFATMDVGCILAASDQYIAPVRRVGRRARSGRRRLRRQALPDDLEDLPDSFIWKRRSPQRQAVALKREETDLFGVDPVLHCRGLYVMDHLVAADNVAARVGQASGEGLGTFTGGRGNPVPREQFSPALCDDRPNSAVTRIGDE